MIWLEEKYINLLSPRLNLFKRTKPNLYAFRCPLCGDSKKNKYKTRGGFYLPPSSQSYNMGCFNCGASMKFTSFLKQVDQSLYDEYKLEEYQEKNMPTEPKKEAAPVARKKAAPKKQLDLASLMRVDELDAKHPVIQYIEHRKIPKRQWNRLYYCPKYQAWISKFDEKNYPKATEHPRLVIPFFDKAGNVARITARAFGAEENRYLYTVVDKASTRLFGVDQIDPGLPVYVVEGPIDSLFLPNAIAVGTGTYEDKELDTIPNKIFVPDNQPRNENVCKGIKKLVDRGEKVCLWQEDTGKDINQMVIDGRSIQSIMKLIEESTFQGPEAQMKFSDWVKY